LATEAEIHDVILLHFSSHSPINKKISFKELKKLEAILNAMLILCLMYFFLYALTQFYAVIEYLLPFLNIEYIVRTKTLLRWI
jgi:hypothetical protein